ncbi:hypothetical protein T484DRAFT_1988900 [Baffinella frigidus]|nr:hypothetical protein T484DRAFT_1988900 [Cryptophyta sp. CCMP2293]
MVLPSFVRMKSNGGRGVTSLSGTWGGGLHRGDTRWRGTACTGPMLPPAGAESPD